MRSVDEICWKWQHGKERAEYGKYILKELSERLMRALGRGFSYDNLK